MLEKEMIVKNESGLHARPASMLMELSNKFKSDIFIHVNEMKIDCKSIISILLGQIYKDTPIKLVIEGEDEKIAFEAIVELIENLEG